MKHMAHLTCEVHNIPSCPTCGRNPADREDKSALSAAVGIVIFALAALVWTLLVWSLWTVAAWVIA